MAQNDSLQKSEYIQTFPNQLAMKVSYVITENRFSYNQKEDGQNREFKAFPNKKNRILLGIQYRAIEANIGISPSGLPGNRTSDSIDSKIYNLNAKGFYKGWIQTLTIYHQRGFTLEENGEIREAPFLETNKFAGSTAYSFNEDFSFRATIGQKEKQLKSVGSVLYKVSYDYTNFVLESSGFENNVNALNLGITPGYYYNYVFSENLFLAAGVDVGFGLNYNDFGDNSIVSSVFLLGGSATLGFNYDRFFGGVYTNLSMRNYQGSNRIKLNDNIRFVEFFIGYRFKAPKILDKTADKVNETLRLPKLND
ncbi:DUF4421 family protein [Galbibacter mesophilus]|uniref:DUF4421 family protein n=1 Tax=Galbibacter mesophilus TaxID=379069 RepID=UPI00191F5329|nr:DUF4421 family protein [Galbibacter mesophilus]MCM5662366.1 DUF4421 domain-containing protein [Galbibacter mesophilus]